MDSRVSSLLFSLERGPGIALQAMQEKKALSSRGRVGVGPSCAPGGRHCGWERAGSAAGAGRTLARGEGLFEGNPVGEGTTRRGTATPVHRPQRSEGSTHRSTRGLRPPEQLERPAGFPSSSCDPQKSPDTPGPVTREPGRAPPRHAHGDLTSLAEASLGSHRVFSGRPLLLASLHSCLFSRV